MKYAVEKGSRVMTHTHTHTHTHIEFHKVWFKHSKVNRWDTHRQHGDRISLFLVLQSKESKLITKS
jgi:hypothetical protein